jgi:hypothetical protein
MNLQNEAIYDIHVITETDCGLLLNKFEEWAAKLGNTTVIRKGLHDKLVCVPSPTGRQPTYKEFFEYANVSLSGRLVLLANADIVFDESLRRIQPEMIMTGEIGFILSVNPPPAGGDYKEAFGTECETNHHKCADCHTNLHKCAVGAWQGAPSWRLAGWSWDAYVFASPLPAKFDYSAVNIVMNMAGAEYIAAYQLEASGYKLYNPCEHVHAWHWHCQGGKMHGQRSFGHTCLANIFPCSHCPGITMPREYGKREDLCRSGDKQWNNQIGRYFTLPHYSVSICCAAGSSCSNSYIPDLKTCMAPDDVNCMIWEFVGKHHTWSNR